jgi:hypothetical protein
MNFCDSEFPENVVMYENVEENREVRTGTESLSVEM